MPHAQWKFVKPISFIALFIQKNQNETFIGIIPEPTQSGQFFQSMNKHGWCMTHLYYTLRNGPSNQTFRLLPIYVLLQSLRFCCVCIDSQTVIIVGKIYFLWWVKNVWAVYTLRRMCKNTIKTLVTLAPASRIAILSNIFPAECLPKTKKAPFEWCFSCLIATLTLLHNSYHGCVLFYFKMSLVVYFYN